MPSSPEPPPRPGRSRRRALLVALLSLGLTLLAAEGLVRALRGAPLPERLPLLEVRAHPTRGWEMVPGVHYTYEHPVHVNALGLRGPELGPRAPGERRLLALGDSLVYGQGVGDGDTLPARLERRLEALDGRPWTVVNGGLRAYATHQELALLEELGPRVEPDVVVLFWYRNDFVERDVAATFERLSAKGPIAFDVGTPLEGRALLAWRARQLLRRSALLMVLHDLTKEEQTDLVDADVVAAGLERLRGYLGRLLELAGERGFRPYLCLIPVPGEVLRGSVPEAPEPAVLALAEELGVEALDLTPFLRSLVEDTGSLPLVPFDGHYAAASNEALAAAVARLVLADEGEPDEPR